MATRSPCRVTAFTCRDAASERNGDAGKLRPWRMCATVTSSTYTLGNPGSICDAGTIASTSRSSAASDSSCSSVRACSISNSPLAGAAQFLQVRAASHHLPQIVRNRAHVGAARTVRAQPRIRALHAPAVPIRRRDLHRLQFHRHRLARQFVGPLAIHLLGRYRRRRLRELAAKPLQQRSSSAAVHRALRASRRWARRRDRRCWWTSRSAPRLRRSCRCAYRTAPGAWPSRSPAAARRWRSDPACPDARRAWSARCGASCPPRRARSSLPVCRLR